MSKTFVSFILVAAVLCGSLWAVEPVPLGAGSYAPAPPPEAGDAAAAMQTRPLYLADPADARPIPTNDWWTQALVERFTGDLWAYPLMVRVTADGIRIAQPDTWNDDGTVLQSPVAIEVRPEDGALDAARVRDWGDWHVQLQLDRVGDGRPLSLTLGHGFPYAWIESAGEALQVPLLEGDTVTAISGGMTVARQGRLFVLNGSLGGTFSSDGKQIRVVYGDGDGGGWLAVSRAPAATAVAVLAKHAEAIPRRTRLQWVWLPQEGVVRTTWLVETDTETAPLTGWQAHHRAGLPEARTLAVSYPTPRGELRLRAERQTTIDWPFQGALPMLPPAAGLDPERLDYYLRGAAGKTDYGGDTYWGGKDLVRLAKYLMIAQATGHDSAPRLQANLAIAMRDWLTWTPGETAHYFAAYPRWGAFIGFAESYGSSGFTDNHFHAGYFTLAGAAWLGNDREARGYAPVLARIAAHYAGRGDADLPRLRTFDPWLGHSWAGGLGSGGGNNQESSSEAIQSWAGVMALGDAMDDPTLRDTGIMGYAMETAATREYWFNASGTTFPANYQHPVVGILQGWGQAYATYFSGDPAWIYGIQWLPLAPYMDYLTVDPAAARASFAAMNRDRRERTGSDAIEDLGSQLANVILGHQLQFDAPAVIAEMDRLWAAESPIARDHYTGGLTWYLAHAQRALGVRDRHYSADTAGFSAYVDGERSRYVVWNPGPTPRLVRVYRHGSPVPAGWLWAAPGSLQRYDELRPWPATGAQPATWPGAGATAVSRFVDALYVAAAPPTAAARLDGPGDLRLRLRPSTDARIPNGWEILGHLQAGATYTATIGETSWAFTVEPAPPLALVSRMPAADARLAVPLATIRLAFNNPLATPLPAGFAPAGAGETDWQVRHDPTDPRVLLASIASRRDTTYRLTVPATLRDIYGQQLGQPIAVVAQTPPLDCPPTVYADTYAGGGYAVDGGLAVDFGAVAADGGSELRLSTGDTGGSIYFFAGSSDHGAGRRALGTKDYDRLSITLRGKAAGQIWLKVGHPVHDQGAFHQQAIDAPAADTTIVLPLPQPREQVNTLLAISLPPNAVVYLDDIRLLLAAPVDPADAAMDEALDF